MAGKKKKVKNLKKNIILILAFVIAVCLIIWLVVFADKRTLVPDNPKGTLGNTGGNLNNQGLFCQDGDTVYFSNPLDNHCLYSMKPDGSDQVKILNMPAKYINVAGDYIYYNQVDTGNDMVYGFTAETHGIYRFKKGTRSNTKGFDRTVAGVVIVIDNYVYYQHYDNDKGMTLYRCTLNGTEKAEVLNKIVNPCCVIDGNILFPDQDDYFLLNLFNADTCTASLFLNERMYNPVYSGGYIYYIGIGDDYPLCRFNISSRTVEKLTDDRVDCFNILGSVIFYQRNDKDEPALIRMSADGSNSSLVAMGNYTNINMTDTYTYFQPYGDEMSIYRVSTTGSPSPEAFVPVIMDEPVKQPSFFKKEE
ncbi:MAG: DUF5050 domain-containing protein [Lachnospiraceae bacterium]|nr:DUF5050 domain-containing protein [Lachnospiraceae bacterium]